MLYEKLESLHAARPFKPFEILTHGGKVIRIDRPEFLGRFPTRDRIFYSTPEDTTETIDITEIDDVQVATSGRRRNPRRRR